MKSNYLTNRTELRKIAAEEAQKQLDEFRQTKCRECSASIGYQTIATMMIVLHRQYGFGRKRLQALKDALETEFYWMENGIPGMKKKEHYTGVYYIEKLKTMGIDLTKSIYDDQP